MMIFVVIMCLWLIFGRFVKQLFSFFSKLMSLVIPTKNQIIGIIKRYHFLIALMLFESLLLFHFSYRISNHTPIPTESTENEDDILLHMLSHENQTKTNANRKLESDNLLMSSWSASHPNQSNHSQSPSEISVQPAIPALIDIGFAKTGSNSLATMLDGYAGEFVSWSEEAAGLEVACNPMSIFANNNPNGEKIIHNLANNEAEQQQQPQRINAKHLNHSFTLLKMFNSLGILSSEVGSKCTIKELQKHWMPLSSSSPSSKTNKFTFDHIPQFSHHPFVAIFSAHWIAPSVGTRFLMVIRNPVTHLWSCYWQAAGKGAVVGNNNHKQSPPLSLQQQNEFKKKFIFKTEENAILSHLTNSNVFMKIQNRCALINTIRQINTTATTITATNSLPNALFSQYYSLMSHNLLMRYVRPNKYMLRTVLDHSFLANGNYIWQPLHFIHFLFWFVAFEESMQIHTQLQSQLHFRVVQFEWIFGDGPKSTRRALKAIRCWVNGRGCENENGNDQQNLNGNECRYSSENSKAGNKQFSLEFAQNVSELYQPCDVAMRSVLFEDKKDLLIGKWREDLWGVYSNNNRGD